MRKPAQNLLGGFLASGIATLTGLLVVPVYVRALGSEAYGLVALFMMLQLLLQVFDLGLTSTASRSVAQGCAQRDLAGARALLSPLAWIAWGVAGVLALALLAAAPFAGRWLQLQDLRQEQITVPLLLMALALGVRWPAGLYQSVLFGADRMARSSAITVATTLLAHGGAAVLLATGAGGLTAFFAWQLFAALVYVTWARAAALGALPAAQRTRPEFRRLRDVRSFSLHMAVIGATGLVLMHMDKLMLSRLLPLAEFGHYMLAGLITSAFYAVVMPIFNWTYPRLTQLATGDPAVLREQYRLISHAVACFFLPLAMGLAVAGEGLLALWLGDRAIAASVAPVLALLAIGNALHAVMFVPHALTLARGRPRLALKVNLALLALLAPLLLVLTLRWGATGAALAWAAVHAAYLLFGGWITHRALLPEVAGPWLRQDVLPVLALSVGLGLAGRGLLEGPWREAPAAAAAACGLLLAALAWALAVAASPRLRRMVRAPFVKSAA